eukprot:jgi/Phyca11/17606/fgenesh1_pg.PHYCAscaffold_29_\
MVVSVSSASRAIFALCSLIAAQGGFAAAQADIGACLEKAGIESSLPTTSTWAVDTEAWNSRVSPVPSAVAFPDGEGGLGRLEIKTFEAPSQRVTNYTIEFNSSAKPTQQDNGVKADASAWKHDDNLHLVRWDMRTSAFNVPFADSSMTSMRTNFYKFVDAYKAAGGVPGGFTTYRDEKWSVPEMAEYLYGGGNFKKLQTIKTAIDPTEMFNTDPQAIPALAA